MRMELLISIFENIFLCVIMVLAFIRGSENVDIVCMIMAIKIMMDIKIMRIPDQIREGLNHIEIHAKIKKADEDEESV